MLISKRLAVLGRSGQNNRSAKKIKAIRISLRTYSDPEIPEGSMSSSARKQYREPINEYTPLFKPVRSKPEDIEGPIVKPLHPAPKPMKLMEDLQDFEDKYAPPKEDIIEHSPKNMQKLRKSKRLRKMFPLDERTDEERKMDKSIASLWNKLLGGIKGGTIVRKEGDRLRDAHAIGAMERLRTYVVKNMETNPTSFDDLAARIEKVQERSAYFASDWSIRNPKIVDKAYRWLMEEMDSYVEGADEDNMEDNDQTISLGTAVDVKAEEADLLADYQDDREIPDRPFDPLELMEFDHKLTVGERKFHTWIAPDEVQYYDDESLQYEEFMKHRPTVERKDLFKSGWRHSYTLDAMNVALLARFMNKTGRILPRQITGLSRSNQKRVATKIRHARHLGLFSYKGSQFRINNPFIQLTEAEKKENPWLVARYNKDQQYAQRVEDARLKELREAEHQELRDRVSSAGEIDFINKELGGGENSALELSDRELADMEMEELEEKGEAVKSQDTLDYERLMEIDVYDKSYKELEDEAVKEGILDEEDRGEPEPPVDIENSNALELLEDTKAFEMLNIDQEGRHYSELPSVATEEEDAKTMAEVEAYNRYVDQKDEELIDGYVQGKSPEDFEDDYMLKNLSPKQAAVYRVKMSGGKVTRKAVQRQYNIDKKAMREKNLDEAKKSVLSSKIDSGELTEEEARSIYFNEERFEGDEDVIEAERKSVVEDIKDADADGDFDAEELADIEAITRKIADKIKKDE